MAVVAESSEAALLNEKALTFTEKEKNVRWSSFQKFSFRVFFLYFLVLCTPFNKEFYDNLRNLKFGRITYLHLQSISSFYPPKFIAFDTPDGNFGFLSYINLIVVFAGALVAGAVWTLLDRRTKEYHQLYYWIRVLARYRFGYAMVAWGLKKVFPHQMIPPTTGVLNTPFGDMAEKKLYWLHVGVQQHYEVFLGLAEFLPGLLLLHRKTAVIGAALAGVVCFNIALANQYYDGGVAVPALYYALIGGFLVAYDLPKIWKAVVNNQSVTPYHYYPSFSTPWQKWTRVGLKTVFHLVFVLWATWLWGNGWYKEKDNYNIPTNPGLPGVAGHYIVTEFRINNKLLPYSPMDSVRWHEADFERWSSLRSTTNRKKKVDRMKVHSPHSSKRDLGMTRFELGGVAGNRQYFYYEVDSVRKELHLQNKNPLYEHEKMRLTYEIRNNQRIVLTGINETSDSIKVILDKVDKKYPLTESRGAYKFY